MLKLRSRAGASVVTGVALGVTLSVLTILQSSATIGDGASVASCKGAIDAATEYGPVERVTRAETANADLVARWQELRFAPDVSGIQSPLRSESSSESIVVCIYAGEFHTPTGPSTADGSANPPHNRLRLLLLPSGHTILDTAGYDGRMDPETPGDWAAANP